MNFQFTCPECGQKVETYETWRGQVAECPYCGKEIAIPNEISEPSTHKVTHVSFASGCNGQGTTAQESKDNKSSGKVAEVITKKNSTATTVRDKFTTVTVITKKKLMEQVGKLKNKEWRDTVSVKARAFTKMVMDKTVALWKNGTKGKVILCTVVLLVLCSVLLVRMRGNSVEKEQGASTYGVQHELCDVQEAEKKVKDYRNAAKQNSATAQFNLGVCYVKGDGVPKDYTEAARWFRLSAEQGNDSAQKNLGVLYCLGYGVPKDTKEGMRWLKEAADQGNKEARELLVEILR